MKESEIKLLKRVNELLRLSNWEIQFADLVYRTPAGELRHKASEIERKDALVKEFRAWLVTLKPE